MSAVTAVTARAQESAVAPARVTIRFSQSGADIAARLMIARRAWQETDRTGLAFDESIVRRGIERKIDRRGKYCLLQAEAGSEAVGMLMGVAAPHFHASELGASLLSWYVLPEHRGSLAAVKLLHGFRRWARDRGAVRFYIGVTSGIDVARTDRLLRRLGFRQTGANYEAAL
ncbi:MAG: GNAT family N-acetyltransferase [Holophagales bacterium]|nr:GNAT family N-acetyltransferase [Holophagales bacterium]